jgi:sortase A
VLLWVPPFSAIQVGTSLVRATVTTDSSHRCKGQLPSTRLVEWGLAGNCEVAGGSKFRTTTRIVNSLASNYLKMQNKTLRPIEHWLLVLGMFLLAVYAGVILHRSISSRFALWQFQKAQAAAPQAVSSTSVKSQAEDGVDFALWSEKRIKEFRESLSLKKDLPMAVLRIEKLGIEVPVFDGTDDLTLNRGVGRIIGTNKPGEPGNIGIAGHRDGFFRGLKDISVGDQVDLMMTTTKAAYVVDQIEIVSPTDVRVLQRRSVPSLTLVTCYPFYFVGDAPQRFIVHASIASGPVIVTSKTQSNFTSAVKDKNHKESTKWIHHN